MAYHSIHGMALGLALFGAVATAGAQTASTTAQGTSASSLKQAHTLDVTSRLGFIDVSLKAEDARLSEVAADLAKRLAASVTVGPSIRQQAITVNIPQSALEPALAALAPRVFVDYEIRQEGGVVPRTIYLLGADDPAPSMSTQPRGQSQGLMITGHTEETSSSAEEDPLQVSGDRRGLMIVSRKQPLSLVAMAVADVLGVQVEMNYEAADPVDIEVKYFAPIEDVIPRLSPNIRLHLRSDVTNQQRIPLKLVLERSAAK